MRFLSFPSLTFLSAAAAEWIAELSQEAIAERGRFTIALSGGETPKMLYETLAKEYAGEIDWNHVHLFWGDERYVPQNEPANNYLMAIHTGLIDLLPQENIHSVPTWLPSPELAAQVYRNDLREEFGEGVPAFDLILLGLGGDGHTASLFPGMTVEEMTQGIAIVTRSPAPPPIRISLSLPVINNARNVAFLVSGSGKREILNAVLQDRGNSNSKYPSAHVQPNGELVWFVDEAAAEKISLSKEKN